MLCCGFYNLFIIFVFMCVLASVIWSSIFYNNFFACLNTPPAPPPPNGKTIFRFKQNITN